MIQIYLQLHQMSTTSPLHLLYLIITYPKNDEILVLEFFEGVTQHSWFRQPMFK